MDTAAFLGREASLFASDFDAVKSDISERLGDASVLVVGGGGAIGRAVVKVLFEMGPRRLDVCDVVENGLVELVRDVRSSLGYLTAGFETLVVDCLSADFERLLRTRKYDYVLNLAALKHVRSESSTFTLGRMVEVNVLSVARTLEILEDIGHGRYFSVSTDKSVNPANLMGATKGVMEQVMWLHADTVRSSSARFANVAFSDGSLLDGWVHRLRKRQPLSAPVDVRRYFITDREAAELCLMACFCGANRDVFVPRLAEADAEHFDVLARRFLELHGYRPRECESEDECRALADSLINRGEWPCYFFRSDTTGEKDLEEFLGEGETIDEARYASIIVLPQSPPRDPADLRATIEALRAFVASGDRDKGSLVTLLERALPTLAHLERGKTLHERM